MDAPELAKEIVRLWWEEHDKRELEKILAEAKKQDMYFEAMLNSFPQPTPPQPGGLSPSPKPRRRPWYRLNL